METSSGNIEQPSMLTATLLSAASIVAMAALGLWVGLLRTAAHVDRLEKRVSLWLRRRILAVKHSSR
jgi:hypothetical protein